MPVIFTAAVPVLVKLTTCALLVVPTACEANTTEVGLTPAAGPRPVPDRLAACGLPDALSVTRSVAM
jgi:hypothetical protein